MTAHHRPTARSSPAVDPVGVDPRTRLLGLEKPERVLVVLGACCVVLGGLVAAAAGPLQLSEGSWVAAYLVLVCGVAQYAIGRASTLLAAAPSPAGRGWAMVVLWNLGNAAVIAGTVIDTPAVLDAGAALLAAGLAIAWLAVQRIDTSAVRSRAVRPVGWFYRGMLLILLISLPVGVVLAHLRDAA